MLESYDKGKDKKKKMKRKDRGIGSREKMRFCEIKKGKKEKKKRVRYYVVGVKSDWERKLFSLQISLQYDLITKE